MSAGSIVIDLDVFEYGLSHVLPGGESLTVNGLNLERVSMITLMEPPMIALMAPRRDAVSAFQTG